MRNLLKHKEEPIETKWIQRVKMTTKEVFGSWGRGQVRRVRVLNYKNSWESPK